ncbi:methionine adenosyltransferase domain-containing protein, partial [Bacillus altitudinis]|uniref:methionine adenosyltransferase domain-containing protein n=1 Tax=Bacillus altitudinis TaxID=293387 RepID=UPI001643896F
YVPKNILPPGLADSSELHLAYPIPLPHPLSISIHTFPTAKPSQHKLIQLLPPNFHLPPPPIIKILHLPPPIY